MEEHPLKAEEARGVTDELDIKILRELSKDARKSSREIASSLGIATGTVYNRISKMIDKGVIRGFIPVVDPERVGYGISALILLQIEGKHIVKVEEELAKFDEVYYLYDVTGEFDVALIGRFRDREALNAFIKRTLAMPYVRRSVTNVVLNVVKEDQRVKV